MNEQQSRASGVAEGIWLKAEQNMARRERVRLIKAGRIRFTAPANVLVKTADGWRFPSLKAS